MSIPTKSLEFLLETWRDHSKTGFHVTFLVSPQDQEFFRACADGQRFTAVLVKLTDQDTPAPLPTEADLKRENAKRSARGAAEATRYVDPINDPKKQEPLPLDNVVQMPEPAEHHGKYPPGLCGLAVKWCQDEHFQKWLASVNPEEWDEQSAFEAEERCKNIICSACGIVSRRELDSNDKAAATFKIDFMVLYIKQRNEDGIDAEAPF